MFNLIDDLNVASNYKYSDYSDALKNVMNGGESAIGLAIISQIIMRHRINIHHRNSMSSVEFVHNDTTYKFAHKFDNKQITSKYIAVIKASIDYFNVVNGK